MIAGMYITMMPVILAGIFNMIFVKTGFYKRHRIPIDGGHVYRDGKRIFGDNKTWIGFLSMIIISMITTILWGYLCTCFSFGNLNELYRIYDNTVLYNAGVGFYLFFSYMLFELPNSFIKRRLSITPGKTENRLFFVIDQIDSLIGVMLILFLVSGISVWKYLFYIFLGGFTHISVNFILYKLKVRRNL